MKYCSKCGEQNPDEAKFCKKCGTKFMEMVEDDPIHEVEKPKCLGRDEVVMLTHKVYPEEYAKLKKGYLWTGILLFLLIGVFVVVIYLVYRFVALRNLENNLVERYCQEYNIVLK